MSGQWHGGKGSKPRPLSVDTKTFDSNWDLAFGKNKKTDTEQFDEQVVMKEEYYDLEETKDELEEYKRQAQEMWNDSCTSPRKK